jgi:probable HAF family extracellular repeat protein
MIIASHKVLVVAALAACGECRAQNYIMDLGTLQGGTGSKATTISSDGSTVVGLSGSSLGGRAFRWTAGTGMQDLGGLSPSNYSDATSVSADGSVVTGHARVGAFDHAFRWTAASGMQDIGLLDGDYAYGRGISADGNVIVGYAHALNPVRDAAYRWSTTGGFQDLGTLYGLRTVANAVSGNGSVVVGVGQLSTSSSVSSRGFRWTQGTGMVDIGVAEPNGSVRPNAVSSTGATIVGVASFLGHDRAFRWTQSQGVQIIGPSVGNTFSGAYATNAGGSVVVGFMGQGSTVNAAMWTADLGMVDLNAYLPTIGVNLDGWQLSTAYGTDFTGTRIVGLGFHNGEGRAFLVQIPSPSSLLPVGLALGAALATRSRRQPA